MIKRKVGLILLLVLTFIISVKADIAPDPGSTRVSINLEIETKEDFSDYRFFLDFYGDLREVEIKRGQNSIPSMGGGARYSSGTLWAIPKKNLADIGESQEEIKKALNEKKITGAVELVRHGFTKTVRESEVQEVKSPKYRLERNNSQGLKLVPASEEVKTQNPASSNTNEPITQDSPILKDSGWLHLSTFIVGGLLAVAVLWFGIWLFRKSGRKLD